MDKMKEEKRKPAPSERTTVIKTYLTEKEAAEVRAQAAPMKLSAYLRMCLLYAGHGRVQITIQTDDLRELGSELYAYNQRMAGIIAALSYRQDLYSSDIENFRKLQQELNETVHKIYKMALTDRRYNRKKGNEYLKAEIDKVLRTAITEIKSDAILHPKKVGSHNERN